ncbi:YkvA family protein [Oceanobacillus sp. CF4.6]|uniref:YkvA family protein n=1 Tax=Oceanobacillus sp. CF4.6 TaxID=3373080 RepID=UPI003EE7C046
MSKIKSKFNMFHFKGRNQENQEENSDKDNYKDELENLDPEKETQENQKHFSEGQYMEKLQKFAKKMGVKISYYSLLLFYAFKSPKTPKKSKATIAGALGYLILPVDVIPDFIPVIGFGDDLAIIIYAVYKVISHIDDEVKGQAHERMKKIFGEDYDDGQIDEDLKPSL